MYSKSNNMEFMPYDNANEVADELFDSLLSRYLVRLETSMRERERESDLIFDSVQLLYYNFTR